MPFIVNGTLFKVVANITPSRTTLSEPYCDNLLTGIYQLFAGQLGGWATPEKLTGQSRPWGRYLTDNCIIDIDDTFFDSTILQLLLSFVVSLYLDSFYPQSVTLMIQF